MQAVIYAGLRNAARDQAIAAAMENESAATVGLIYSLSPSAVYGARRRITSLATFDLKLLGGRRLSAHWKSRRRVIPKGCTRSLPKLLRHLPSIGAALLGNY